MPLRGCSWTKRARIRVRTGISRAAQSIRSWPCAARSRSLTSLPLVLTFKSLVISSIHNLADHFDAVEVHLELVGAVFELIRVTDRLPGQLSDLADRDEPGTELDRNRSGRDETAGFDRRHQVRRRVGPPLRHHVDDLAEELLS